MGGSHDARDESRSRHVPRAVPEHPPVKVIVGFGPRRPEAAGKGYYPEECYQGLKPMEAEKNHAEGVERGQAAVDAVGDMVVMDLKVVGPYR